MPKLPTNASKKTSNEMFKANSSQREIQKISKEAIKKKKDTGDTTGCQKIRTDKTTFYVKPNQDIDERLEHYRLRYPDAKIVK